MAIGSEHANTSGSRCLWAGKGIRRSGG
jgi:hypothetical protein